MGEVVALGDWEAQDDTRYGRKTITISHHSSKFRVVVHAGIIERSRF
jgi:hypothetical protein